MLFCCRSHLVSYFPLPSKFSESVHKVLCISFFKKLFYWSIIDLQGCVNFCCIAKWFSYTCCCCSVAKPCTTLGNPTAAACQPSLSFTISWSSLKFMSIESVMPSNHLILCRLLSLLPSIFPSITGFSWMRTEWVSSSHQVAKVIYTYTYTHTHTFLHIYIFFIYVRYICIDTHFFTFFPLWFLTGYWI